jgi:hypothetical protein
VGVASANTSITLEDLEHYGLRAQEICGTPSPSLEDYERLAAEAEAESRFYAAAVYYKLAEGMAAGEDESSLSFAKKVVEMMNRVEGEQSKD